MFQRRKGAERPFGRRFAWDGLAAASAVTASVAYAGTANYGTARSAGTVSSAKAQSTLVTDLAVARLATTKYVSDLGRAKKDGYMIITRMIPTMGYHYMNPAVKGFDLHSPSILVYEHRRTSWQLGALEWVFTSKPAHPPIPGARYGAFGAGCHYADGTFIPADAQAACKPTAPGTNAKFTFWHPRLVTLHVWLWYPNPNGLFASTNPLVAAYNKG